MSLEWVGVEMGIMQIMQLGALNAQREKQHYYLGLTVLQPAYLHAVQGPIPLMVYSASNVQQGVTQLQ